MAFRFPDPLVTSEFTGANGVTYQWDTVDEKWVIKGFSDYSRIGDCLDDVNNETVCDRLGFLQNEIIELEEEIEALAPSLERGKWTYNPLGSAGVGQYSMYDSFGAVTSDFTKAATIFINAVDSNSVAHGFSDVTDGSYLEIFEDTDADFGLYRITDVDNQTGGATSFWSLTVDFVKSNSDTTNASGLARFKIFELADAADPTAFVQKVGDNMEGTLDMKGAGGRNKILNPASPTSDYHAANKIYVDDQVAELLAKIEELEMASGTPPESYYFRMTTKSYSSNAIGYYINSNEICSVDYDGDKWEGGSTHSLTSEKMHIYICFGDGWQLNPTGFMQVIENTSSKKYDREGKLATYAISEVEACPPDKSFGKNIYRARIHVHGLKEAFNSFLPSWSGDASLSLTFTGGSVTKVP